MDVLKRSGWQSLSESGAIDARPLVIGRLVTSAHKSAPPYFDAPPHLEAREPPEARGLTRDGVRLLVSHREDGRIEHATFRELPAFLRAGDLLVVNASATLPAALPARTAEGADVRLHVSTRLPAELYIVEVRERSGTPASGAPASTMALPEGASVKLLAGYRDSKRLWVASFAGVGTLQGFLRRHGRPIGYPYLRGEWPIEAYQTVYAAVPGSAEMPSAGRPFTFDVLERLRVNGVAIARLVLHAGVASIERDEPPYEEWYEVPQRAALMIEAARRSGGRVIAVGTTVVRALESAVDEDGRVSASNGWTDLVITPQRGVRTIDGLLTGLHEPASTHLAMLESIAGEHIIARAYRAASEHGYLWHEFGDSHLIL